ncbi:MAG: ATP-binding protein [Acidobacteriota bacterium]|nr:ATP-binding protein [Acidobacteriota bacterium]
MTLFLKIFLWFWLAMALIVGALTFVAWTQQNEPVVRQWQTVVGETANVHAQTAAQIYDAEGKAGLDVFLERLENAGRITAIGLYKENGEQISGSDIKFDVKSILGKSLASGTAEFERNEKSSLIARKTSLKSGETVVLVTQWERPQSPNFFPLSQSQILRILAVILTAGLVCYALALYMTAPISKLRQAARQFAGGDLHTRLDVRRRDELGELAREFDQMAERIETLVTSEKRLTQDISHELRSPLARLNVALELARGKANPETQKLIERIAVESNRLNEMISRLLVLSKLETGSENFEKHEINLTKVFEQTVADADFEAQGNNKSVKIRQKDEVKVFGNETLLRSAIENVLRNAVRYTKEETAVEVKLTKNGKTATVLIKDYGAGVPEEELDKLFRPFYRVNTARDRKTGGIGLGLAIAERAVHAHHGSIKAKNISDGLAVEIILPTA